MRKRLIPSAQQDRPTPEADWLDLEQLAEVEITSEEPDHPIEGALLNKGAAGWRAAHPGEQTIRLIFARPQPIQRIFLEFKEASIERTQELVLQWVADDEQSPREIVRQQWNFSPDGATSETEDYRVNLLNASLVELRIIPDISGGQSRATLARFRLA